MYLTSIRSLFYFRPFCSLFRLPAGHGNLVGRQNQLISCTSSDIHMHSRIHLIMLLAQPCKDRNKASPWGALIIKTACVEWIFCSEYLRAVLFIRMKLLWDNIPALTRTEGRFVKGLVFHMQTLHPLLLTAFEPCDYQTQDTGLLCRPIPH